MEKNNNNPKRKYSRKPKTPKVKENIRIVPLGGLGEIGKNMTVFECREDKFIIDCGLSFPDSEMFGVDLVIPDFSYVIENKDSIRGIVITHGHEDHIGSLPYLLRDISLPIYATPLTKGLIENKLSEHYLEHMVQINEIQPGDRIQFGCMTVVPIHVNHSIPDAVGVIIKTPVGTVVQTGDFKIDTTPIDGEMINLARFAELGKQGVLALLSDSTNAERPGFSASERIVGDSFSNLFKKASSGRIIVASFSSNIHRIQQIIDEAVKIGRKVAVIGRSMQNVVQVASELGYLTVPENTLIEMENINKYPNDKLVIITTGSQGEPLSALHRMAYGDHRQVGIMPDDLIIISATPIPGNEKLVSKVINELMKQGATVVYEKMYDVHVSGHACQEELKLMLSLTKPKFFIPVHGEPKHLYKHAGLAESMGIKKDNIVISNIGDVIELHKKSVKISETVPAGRVLVDGLGVGDVGSIVLRDRKHLAEDGVIVISLTIDGATKDVLAGPEIISRGFVYVRESEELMEALENNVCHIINNCLYNSKQNDWNTLKTKLRDGTSKFLYERTRRSPMILPIIMEI